jgi:EAL domain-containing protein (putative c-di-GMP-specific phosphodiesterase class I)
MLERYLDFDALDVAFQPVVNLVSARPLGYEVLGRARDQAVGPSTLIELAATEGRLFELEVLWRRVALRRIVEHEGRSRATAPVVVAEDGGQGSVATYFLNVDARTIADPAFRPGLTRRLLAEVGLSPGRFVYEINERRPGLGSVHLETLVAHYAGQGFRVALDDVGVGHAGVTSLLRVRPHFLKLDATTVRRLPGDPRQQRFVSGLVDVAGRRGMRVVATGIERPEELTCLLDAGVTAGQGNLLGAPAPAPTPDAVPEALILDLVRALGRERAANPRVTTPSPGRATSATGSAYRPAATLTRSASWPSSPTACSPSPSSD